MVDDLMGNFGAVYQDVHPDLLFTEQPSCGVPYRSDRGHNQKE